MADAFLEQGRPAGKRGGKTYDWSPPEHPDVTLYTPAQAPEADRDGATALEEPMPVWVELDYTEIGHLRTHGFAIAASDRAVLVDTSWQVRLQKVWVPRHLVTHRKLKPRGRINEDINQMRRELSHQEAQR